MDGILIIIIIISGLIGLWLIDKMLNENEIDKIENDQEYAKLKEEEFERLKTRRTFYGVSWLSLCFITAIVCVVFNLEKDNPKLFHIFLSLLMIYGGIGGLFARMVILKLPISMFSKLGYIFNSALALLGVYDILTNVLNVL